MRGAHALDDMVVDLGDHVGVDLGSPGAAHSSDVVEVLHRNDDTVQRIEIPGVGSRQDDVFGLAGLFHSQLRGQGDERAHRLVEVVGAAQVVLGQLHRRELTRSDGRGLLERRQMMEVSHPSRLTALPGCSQPSFA